MNVDLNFTDKFQPRHYQWPVIKSIFGEGKKRICLLAHRRSGKDLLMLNIMQAWLHYRKGSAFHIFPTAKMGRDIIFNGNTNDGTAFLDYFDSRLIKAVNQTHLRIDFNNGSHYQVRGADTINKTVGTNPNFVVLSEWSLMDPQVDEYIKPILIANGGVLVYIYTPRGRNHAYNTFITARNNPDKWGCFIQPVNLTRAIDLDDLHEELDNGMDENLFKQEYFCDFNAASEGTYYGEYIEASRQQGRIGEHPYNENLPVHTAWDFGHSDATAIIFFQKEAGNEHEEGKIRIIDYYENNGKDFEHYAQIIINKRYKTWGQHYAPHDLNQHEMFAGKSRKESASQKGIIFTELQKWAIEDGINAVRENFSRFLFNVPTGDKKLSVGDERKSVSRLVRAAREYSKEFDRDKQLYDDKPKKNWTSHPMDALRYLAMSLPRKLNPTHKSVSIKQQKKHDYRAIYGKSVSYNPLKPKGKNNLTRIIM